MSSYEQVTSNYYSVEQEEKFRYVDMIRKNKDIIKKYRKKWKIKDIENDITFSNCFSLTTMECLSFILKLIYTISITLKFIHLQILHLKKI